MAEDFVVEIRARASANGDPSVKDVRAVLTDAARQAGWALEDLVLRPVGSDVRRGRGWTGVHAGERIGERRGERNEGGADRGS